MILRKITEKEQKRAAKEFAEHWKDKGYEKGQSQPFWIELLRTVYGVEDPEQTIIFEDKVALDHTSFIDGRIAETKVLIEQKSLGKDLDKPIKQSDGSSLTPFQQAKRYSAELPYSQRPRWIVTSNFSEFRIYDLEKPNADPEVIQLKDLPKEFYRMNFLVDDENENIKKEMEISLKAGEIVGKLYDALLQEYENPTDPETLKDLNILCVRLVFCLYAEDAGLFGKHLAFHDYLYERRKFGRDALRSLFRILDTKVDDRGPYEDEELLAFPYVNGGLFEKKEIEVPRLNDEILNLILKNASEDFDWSTISPTIFGAVFESTLNPETRRSGGMHYTSVENIHKVIDPLFLDELRAELERIRKLSEGYYKRTKLRNYQNKLASLTWLDPAAGSGNFLTETFICIRRLENEAIDMLHRGQGMLDVGDIIKVSINQFHGIEINDFAVTVAKTALWIAESQMMKETEDLVHQDLEFLPLKTQANIVEGNALRIDWNDVVDKNQLNYIMGNPPFVGYSLQNQSQKQDILNTFVDENGNKFKSAGKIDYVAGWYFKAAEMIRGTQIRAAFVSTNSITQGEQVSNIWKPIYSMFDIEIDFAYSTFVWSSEASLKAQVFCVIIGFSRKGSNRTKRLFNNNAFKFVENLNPYLIDAPNIFLSARKNPLWNVPKMDNGGKPAEGGFLILTEEEMLELTSKEQNATKLIRPFMMGKDFINRKPRYCLWLYRADPKLIRSCPSVIKRVENVREFRLASKKKATQKKAQTPTLFDEIKELEGNYVALPKVSSGMRTYIPIDYLDRDIIPGDKLFVIQHSTIYHFGVITSIIHMAWMRTVAGKLGSSYSYSNTVVYNNFPWPEPTDKQKAKIEETAQAILDARDLYPDLSLADLYDELVMPVELRKAHQANDQAVMDAYGFIAKDMTESKIVEELFKLYQKKVDELEAAGGK